MKRTFFVVFFLFLIGGGVLYYRSTRYALLDISYLGSAPVVSPSNYADKKADIQRKQIDDVNIYNSAIESQDIHLCEEISQGEKKSECMDMIHSTTAQKGLDPTLCSSLSSSGASVQCRDNIIASQAQKDKNKILCSSISDESLQKYCKETLDTLLFKEKTESNTLSPEFCSTLEPESTNSCLALLAQKDDTTLYQDAIASHILANCAKIRDQSLFATCRDTLLLEQAIREKDINICNQVADLPKKQFCIQKLSKNNTSNDFASIVTSGDMNACQGLANEKIKNQCHDMIIISQVRKTKDATPCLTLINTGMLSTCAQGAN